MQMTVTLEVRLPYRNRQAGKWRIASCPVLDVHSQGTSRAKALQNLVEMIELFLLSCLERGVLNQVLKDSGLKPLSAVEQMRARSRVRAARDLGLVRVRLPFLAGRRSPRTSAGEFYSRR